MPVQQTPVPGLLSLCSCCRSHQWSTLQIQKLSVQFGSVSRGAQVFFPHIHVWNDWGDWCLQSCVRSLKHCLSPAEIKHGILNKPKIFQAMTHLRWSGKTLWDFYFVKSDLWEWWRSTRNGGSSPLPSHPYPDLLHPDIFFCWYWNPYHQTLNSSATNTWAFFWKLKWCNFKRCEGSSILSPCLTPVCSSCQFGTDWKGNCCCEIQVLGYQKCRNTRVTTVLSCPHPKNPVFYS